MTDAREVIRKGLTDARETAAEERRRYANGAERPLGGYGVLLSTYGLLVLTLTTAVRRRGGLPERCSIGDFALLAVATHKLSRLVTKDSVLAPLRAPFSRFEEPAGEGEVHEEVRGEGLRHAIGELVSCPFCIGVWVATTMTFALVLAPRPTRFVATIFSSVAASDFLQLAYATAQKAVREG